MFDVGSLFIGYVLGAIFVVVSILMVFSDDSDAKILGWVLLSIGALLIGISAAHDLKGNPYSGFPLVGEYQLLKPTEGNLVLVPADNPQVTPIYYRFSPEVIDCQTVSFDDLRAWTVKVVGEAAGPKKMTVFLPGPEPAQESAPPPSSPAEVGPEESVPARSLE